MHIEDVFHSGDELPVRFRRDDPTLFLMRTKFCFQHPPDGGGVQVGNVLDQCYVLLEQSQAPPVLALVRFRTGQRDQAALDLAGHDRGHRRKLTLLSVIVACTSPPLSA